MNEATFSQLDFGTKATTVKFEEIQVTINPDLIINDYAEAYSKELHRRNPSRASTVGVTKDELFEYFKTLLAIRVESISNDCKVWRQAKALLIPTWMEFVLSRVGEVIDNDRGLKITPIFEFDYDINRAFETSDKLRAFLSDGLVLHKDAFPRTPDGDVETMSMVIIDDYVTSQTKDAHPIASYVAAFLGYKLKEELAFKMLYRVRYDDVNFISSMLLREGTVY